MASTLEICETVLDVLKSIKTITNSVTKCLILQTILFVLSFLFFIFDLATDWVVVHRFNTLDFNHPLITPNNDVKTAWIFFTVIGTLLAVITIVNDCASVIKNWMKIEESFCRTAFTEILSK
jgi:hypothetical protein